MKHRNNLAHISLFLSALTLTACVSTSTKTVDKPVPLPTNATSEGVSEPSPLSLNVTGVGTRDGGIGTAEQFATLCSQITPLKTRIDVILAELGQPHAWNVKGGAPDFVVWRTADQLTIMTVRIDKFGTIESAVGRRDGGFVFANRSNLAIEKRCILQEPAAMIV